VTASRPRAAARLLAAAAATRALYEGGRALAGGRARLVRVNYRGRRVDLLGGPAVGVAAVGGALLDASLPTRVRTAAAVAAGAAALAGAIDDAVGSPGARGFRGHLVALRSGEVTTGAVKIAAIGTGGLVAGLLAVRGPLVRRLAAGAVVALSANLANLLDLRPGRTLKAAAIAGVPLAASSESTAARRVATLALGASAGLLGPDLRERTMLGDAGANCLGALLGVAAVTDASGRRIALTLGALVALTATSEVVSFSSVIEKNTVLRAIDQAGRREVAR
jgi:UDP-N-acetylmuramyl pentapeptide phosphotransferase/UDP-N-acetylglucosamine-1-phosphate transferase